MANQKRASNFELRRVHKIHPTLRRNPGKMSLTAACETSKKWPVTFTGQCWSVGEFTVACFLWDISCISLRLYRGKGVSLRSRRLQVRLLSGTFDAIMGHDS